MPTLPRISWSPSLSSASSSIVISIIIVLTDMTIYIAIGISTDIFIDVFVDIFADMFVDVIIDMLIGMFIDIYVDMFLGISLDIFIDLSEIPLTGSLTCAATNSLTLLLTVHWLFIGVLICVFFDIPLTCPLTLIFGMFTDSYIVMFIYISSIHFWPRTLVRKHKKDIEHISTSTIGILKHVQPF